MTFLLTKFISSRFSGWLSLALLIVLIGAASAFYFKGYAACEDDAQTKHIEIMEKRNEIANNRPDSAATIERLRNGTF